MQRRLRPTLERLEAVFLPAASVTASIASNVLVVTGTEAGESIEVRLRVLSANARAQVVNTTILVNGRATYRALGRFKTVQINGLGGDDRLAVAVTGRYQVPALLNGGDGTDTLFGSAANDTLLGGNGIDLLWGGGGSNSYDGGEGRDAIEGVLEPISTTPTTPTPPTTPTTPTPPTTPTTPTPVTPTRTFDTAAVAQEIVDRTNRARIDNGVGTLRVSAALTEAARLQAQQMADAGIMSHSLPNTRYPNLIDRARAVGYTSFSRLGENIAFNYPDAANVMMAWLLSQGHRDNLLHPAYSEIGVAVVLDSKGQPYYAQVFGAPA
jgi:uncharacterized protein YkwD